MGAGDGWNRVHRKPYGARARQRGLFVPCCRQLCEFDVRAGRLSPTLRGSPDRDISRPESLRRVGELTGRADQIVVEEVRYLLNAGYDYRGAA